MRSASLGLLVWLVLPFVPVGVPPGVFSLEHAFLCMPLILMPLALVVLGHRLAARLAPIAASLVAVAFLLPRGPLAGALAVPWLALAVLIAASGLRRPLSEEVLPHPGPLPEGEGNKQASCGLRRAFRLSIVAAHVLLPLGAVWLLLSRLGVAPGQMKATTVFLATVHFHFSGFVLQVLIAATGERLARATTAVRNLHRALSIAAVAGIPMIAAGNLAQLPALKLAGVVMMVLSSLSLAVTSTHAARESSGTARALLLVSAGSIGAGMLLAAIYGIGEFAGLGWIGLERMVPLHGLINAFGFGACGLVANVMLRSDSALIRLARLVRP